MDDILVFCSNQAEHDARLQAALIRISNAGVTLNAEKCEFSRTEITFLGHVVNTNGISADPGKTKAIRDMSAPTTVTELRRFLGMANQLGKLTPNLAELTEPLCDLSKSTSWIWGTPQSTAFKRIKEELFKPTTLALYGPQHPQRFQQMHQDMAWEQFVATLGGSSYNLGL